MKRNTIIILVIAIVMAIIIITSLTSGQDDEAYIARIEQQRGGKDRDMRYGADSPFLRDSVEYNGLKYFPIDSKYKIRAKLEPISNKKIVTLSTSDGKKKQYLEFAHAVFEMDDKINRLLILENVGGEFDGMLFLPFGDATSAYETYGAGRYLELAQDGENAITIDFNEAYNPYCAYTDGFSCPFPPSGNLLTIPIRAGEMNYDESY